MSSLGLVRLVPAAFFNVGVPIGKSTPTHEGRFRDLKPPGVRTRLSLTRTFFIHVFIFLYTHLLSSFWTSRGHRCRPFSPPVFAIHF